MAKQFRFPDVGEGITEGEIVRWLVKEGDEVKEDQPLGEIETDKAIAEMPSPYSGTVLKIHFKEKEIVKVGQVLVTIGEKGEAIPEQGAPAEKKEEKPQEEKPKPAPSVVGVVTETKEEIKEVLATPKVRRLALDLGVDLKKVKGTGPQGRITEEDVRQAKPAPAAEKAEKPAVPPVPEKEKEPAPPAAPAEEKKAAPAPAPEPEKKPSPPAGEKPEGPGETERILLRGVRRATAKRMALSVSTAAHVTHFDEAEATELTRIKESLSVQAADRGIKFTYLPIIVKAVVETLKVHPLVNSTLDDEEEEIIVKKYYNIGIAVDVPDGLIVPVVKAADQKSVFAIAQEIQALAESAKKRRVNLADLRGGTFSITNVGMIGGEAATPIVNYPEVAILATMKIKDRVRVVDGQVQVKKTLPLCLSFDHRVIDGAEAARFMNDLIGFLESADFLKKLS
jgi:pyruvate dehydrogenase E2 component (dihydrolipoamide acetyltransferase)